MGQQSKSKRTSALVPMEIPLQGAQAVPPPGAHPIPPQGAQLVPPPGFPSMVGPGTWFSPHPLQSMAASSAPCWLAGAQPPGVQSSLTQGPWWTQSSHVPATVSPWPVAKNVDDTDVQAWGVDPHPSGGFLNFLNSTQNTKQAVRSGSAPQLIDVSDDGNGSDSERTEKRLPWTKEEDLRLVSAWLNNSNDPINSNYKKNDQYWKDVAAVYNSTTPKNRARLVKQVKDRFARIKKNVQWFCASWKEANALYASGESDVDLMERALKTYEEDHKKDGPFMFKHCWDVLRKEPKWDAYLERLEEPELEKRKFSDEGDVGQHFSLDNIGDERPIGGKKAKEQLKKKKKDQACILDLEDELHKFVDAQNKAIEGRKEMPDTQRRVSSENLEAKKLTYLAAKEQKESIMLETYRSLLTQDSTVMSEDVRVEHVAALRCLREKLFSQTN